MLKDGKSPCSQVSQVYVPLQPGADPCIHSLSSPIGNNMLNWYPQFSMQQGGRLELTL